MLLDFIERSLVVDRISFYKLSGLPDSFGVVLLSFSFILLLAPYFSGADFGLFKIPLFTQEAKKWLKIIGPALFFVFAISFAPIISVEKTDKGSEAKNPSSGLREPVVFLRKFVRKSATEADSEQFYILFFKKFDSQVAGGSRRPEPGYYEMSSNKPFGPQRIDDIPLKPSHGCVMYILIMKAGDALPSDWKRRSEELLKSTGDPKIMSEADARGIARDLISVLPTEQGANVIGSLAVQVTNQNGNLEHRWFQTLGGVIGKEESDQIVKVEFKHDGSKYIGEFFLDVSQGSK